MIVAAPDGKNIDFGNMQPMDVQVAMQKLYPPQTPQNQMVQQDKFEMGQGMSGVGKQLGAYGLNALQAIPFSDEAISGVGAAFGGGQGQDFGSRYTDLQQRQQAMREAGQQLNPSATMLGQISGGLATAPLMPVGGPATTLAGNVGRGVLTGAAYGGAYGAGNGNAFQSGEDSAITRLQNGLTGGLEGGLLGAAVPLVASGLTYPFTRQPSGQSLAAKNITDVLNRDKIDINNIPPDQNILQAGDKGATARAEAITTRGGLGADQFTNYAVDQKASLPQDLSQTLGSKFQETNYPALLDAIKLKARTEAGPAYDAAYGALTKINDPEINQALDRAVAAGDWPVLTSEAKKLAAYEGKTLGNIDATGNLRSFSTQDLDYMTRALRNLGQGTEGMGAFGNMTPLGAMRANTSGSIRDRLKELNPLFADASNQYAGDIAMSEAAQSGKQANLFGSNWKQAVYDYQNLSPVEQKAWRLGQAENLQNMISNNPGTALSRFNSPQFSKVMSYFYSPQDYDELMGNVSQLMKQSNQVRQFTGNSRTALRALQQASDAADSGNIPQDIVSKGPTKAAKDFVMQKVLNRLSNSATRQSADSQVARTLLSTPFQLASQQAGGFMNPSMQGALTGNPFVNNTILYNNQLNQLNPALLNYMMSGDHNQ